ELRTALRLVWGGGRFPVRIHSCDRLIVSIISIRRSHHSPSANSQTRLIYSRRRPRLAKLGVKTAASLFGCGVLAARLVKNSDAARSLTIVIGDSPPITHQL